LKKVFLSVIGAVSIFSLNATPLSLDFTKGQVVIKGECKIEISSAKTNNGYTEISAENCVLTGAVGEPQLPVYTQLVTLPENGNFTLSSNNLQYEEITLSKPLIYSGVEDTKSGNTETYAKNEWYPKEPIKVGKPVIMAGNRFSQLVFYPVQYNPVTNKIRVAKKVKLDFNLDLAINDNPLKNGKSKNPSPAFNNLLAAQVRGFEPVKSLNGFMRYLIIAPTGYETSLNYLVKWKRQLGFDTKLLTVGNDITNTQLKALIQAEYDNLSTRPDFVVLVGDVDGAIKLPSNFVTASFPYGPDYDVTDHTYTLLEGDDYFSDVLIGRISVRNLNELNTVISKIIKYEREPYAANNWTKRALMMSYTIGTNPGWSMFSQKETVLAVKDKLENYGYSEVMTYIEPEQSGGANQINNLINTGCGFINYRGTGTEKCWFGVNGAAGMEQEMYSLLNIPQLNNGSMLPMVTSIVCGGGAFDDVNTPTCFGETWLIAGTSSQPK